MTRRGDSLIGRVVDTGSHTYTVEVRLNGEIYHFPDGRKAEKQVPADPDEPDIELSMLMDEVHRAIIAKGKPVFKIPK